MNTDEWESVRSAGSINEKIVELTELAQAQTSDDESFEDTVHRLIHGEYLLKHTTSDVLRELRELEQEYPDEFYDGEANNHILKYIDSDQNPDFWHEYPYLFLAAGLEWAVLNEVETVASR
jgi:hypothetical protein